MIGSGLALLDFWCRGLVPEEHGLAQLQKVVPALSMFIVVGLGVLFLLGLVWRLLVGLDGEDGFIFFSGVLVILVPHWSGVMLFW